MTHFLCVSEVEGEGGADVGNHRAVETEITITLLLPSECISCLLIGQQLSVQLSDWLIWHFLLSGRAMAMVMTP